MNEAILPLFHKAEFLHEKLAMLPTWEGTEKAKVSVEEMRHLQALGKELAQAILAAANDSSSSTSQLRDQLRGWATDLDNLNRIYSNGLTAAQRISREMVNLANSDLFSATSFTPPDVHKRYAAPFRMVGGKDEWVQVRFVSHQHIKDKPTEANPTPVRVIIVGDLERVQPHAIGGGMNEPDRRASS